MSALRRAASTCMFCFLILLSSAAESRVFDFKRESFAVYFGGSFGSSNAGTQAYGSSSGASTSTTGAVQSTTSAEFGFLFSASHFNFRLGGEYLIPRDQASVTGTDAAGNQLFTLHSTITALVPEATLELMPYRGPNSRVLLGLGYGYAMVSLNNQYTMTTAGTSALGVGSYNEVASATAPLYQAYLSWEFLFTDTVTLCLNAGYRYLVVSSLQATQSAVAITGSESQGGNLLNNTGGNRGLNLGGGFAGLSFQFYL